MVSLAATRWGKYDDRIEYKWDDGSFDVYGVIGASGSSGHFAYDTVAKKWYVAWPTWKTFDIFGP